MAGKFGGNKDFDEVVVLELSRKEIEAENFKRIFKGIKRMQRLGVHSLEKHLLSITGYEEDKGRFFERPEVHHFFEVVLDQFPALFLFLSDYGDNKGLLALLCGEVSTPDPLRPMEVDVLIPERYARQIIRGCQKFAALAFMDEEDIWPILRKYPFDYELPDPEGEHRKADLEKEAVQHAKDERREQGK